MCTTTIDAAIQFNATTVILPNCVLQHTWSKSTITQLINTTNCIGSSSTHIVHHVLKLTASNRLSAPPSGSPKCLRFGYWLTLCTLNINLLTYLLTAQSGNVETIKISFPLIKEC